MATFLAIVLSLVGFLLMFVILLQRGRGGGLAGALGGAGGQSAFGTKAGDVFTKITIGMAVVWVILSGVTGMAMYSGSIGKYPGGGNVPAAVGEQGETDATEDSPAGLLEPNKKINKKSNADNSSSDDSEE